MHKRLSVRSLLLFACICKKIREWRFIQVISESLSDYRKVIFFQYRLVLSLPVGLAGVPMQS